MLENIIKTIGKEKAIEILDKSRTVSNYVDLSKDTGIDLKTITGFINELSKRFNFSPVLPLGPDINYQSIRNYIEGLFIEGAFGEKIKYIGVREISEEELKLYVYDVKYIKRKIYDDVVKVIDAGFTPYLVGVAGTGKTAFVEWYSSEYKIPAYIVNCDIGDLRGLLGNWVLVPIQTDGVAPMTEYQFGILTKMFLNNSIILFDEVNALDPEYLFFLHEVINNRRFALKEAPALGTKELHPECKMVLASNPSNYLGTKPLNIALLSRVIVIEFDIFTEEELKAIFPGIEDENLKLFKEVNDFIIKNSLNTVFSIRELHQYMTLKEVFKDKAKAIKYAFLNKAKQSIEPEQIPDLQGLLTTLLGVEL